MPSSLGDVSHDGGCAGAGAAAHAGGDEHHICVLQGLGDLVAVLLGGLAAHLRVGTGSLAVGELLTDLDLIVAADTESACLSVLMAIKSTPLVPVRTMRLTTLFPPPPHRSL